MTEPERTPDRAGHPRADDHGAISLGDADPRIVDGGEAGPGLDAVPSRRPGRATVGTILLLGLMAVTGVVAAYLATPRPDEEAMARPGEADVVVVAGAPLSWDPAAIADSNSAQMLTQVFDGLTVLDADSQVQPALAESWTVADDGRSIDFVLRDGLTFSDGTPLSAEDVRRSWLRVLDPARPSPLSSLLDDVVGAAAHARGEAPIEDVGISAEGRTLHVDFTRPAAYFPAVAAVPTLAVVPPSFRAPADARPEDGSFAASGAYVPESSQRGEIRLRANEAWWAGEPELERISVLTDVGGRSGVDVFEDGAVDWTPIPPDDAAWIRYDQRLGPQLREGSEVVLEMLGFDTSRPPFDDPAVRRAVAMAVDWQRMAALDGEAETPTSLLPPGMPGSDGVDRLLPHDPDAARAELAAAGHPGGAGLGPVTLATYGVGPAEAIAHEIERELGIRVVVESWPFDDHATLLDTDTPHLWTMAWRADYPHPHDILGLLLLSGSSANEGRWSDAHFDELIDAAAATTDPTEQRALYAEAQDIVRDEVPLIPIGYGEGWALSREGLRGADVSGVGLMRYAELAWQ
jgi:oligopeptide transport system substrate-binding protein